MLRRNCILSVFLFIAIFGHAQSFTVYNDGLTTVRLDSGLTATIVGNFVSQTNGSDGQIDNQGIIEVTGNWDNNNDTENVFSTSAGSVEFIGTSNQTIDGTTKTNFYDFLLNNTTSGGGVTLSTAIDISGNITLTDGTIFSDATHVLTVVDGGGSLQGSASSFIDGPLRKAGTSSFVFHLGDGTRYAPLAIGAPTSSTTFEAEYNNGAYTNTLSMASSPTPVLTNVSITEYWDLTRVSGSGNATVTLYWENTSLSGINDCSDLRIAHWNGTSWQNNHDGTTTTTGSCGTGSSGSISTTDNVTSFSPFTFGSKSGLVNPLPVEYLSFEAEVVNDVVYLYWSTASETNNDYFTVERSGDATNFEKVVAINGAGTSAFTHEYEAKDKNPRAGISYYRLKQTDFDGMYAYSELIAVEYVKGHKVKIFPNPVDGRNFNFYIDGNRGEELLVVMYNSMGIPLYSQALVLSDAHNRITINLPHQVEPGVYVVQTQINNTTVRQKVMVN